MELNWDRLICDKFSQLAALTGLPQGTCFAHLFDNKVLRPGHSEGTFQGFEENLYNSIGLILSDYYRVEQKKDNTLKIWISQKPQNLFLSNLAHYLTRKFDVSVKILTIWVKNKQTTLF